MRAAFRDALLDLAEADERVIFLTGDLGFGVFDAFIARFPNRYVNVGVAEALLVDCAAGLALEGWRPIVYSIASFMTGRAWEQIRVAVGYHELPVTVVGAGGGYTYATSGVTHHAKDDLALMALIPGMTVVSPGDPLEARALLPQLVTGTGPSYMRIGRFGEPVVESPAPIVVGKGRVLREGRRVCLVSTGGSMVQVVEAADELLAQGMNVAVAHFHTLVPFDVETFDRATRDADAVVIVEDHGPRGGLAAEIPAHILRSGRSLRVVRLGPDADHVFGNPTQELLQRRVGSDAPGIVAAAGQLWRSEAAPALAAPSPAVR